jgi:hypothetical protein
MVQSLGAGNLGAGLENCERALLEAQNAACIKYADI